MQRLLFLVVSLLIPQEGFFFGTLNSESIINHLVCQPFSLPAEQDW